ncbi:hypothetical protein CS388_06400 [Porphyromonas gingivalis]|nr:hypothetical protein CS545_01245 [Porphyromonas gingivalis]ATS08687.1 hypothetical protein CS388_06400 [Porphyromonas gingivalis]
MSTAKIQIIRYFFKHNAHVLWAFNPNQKTNPLTFSYVELTYFIVCRPIVLCVYGMINDTKRWHDKENHPTRRGLIQRRHVSESI